MWSTDIRILRESLTDALEVFCLYEAQGEFFDISNAPRIVRETIIIGETEAAETGFFVGEGWINN